ncbi:MAG: VTT domain-containing protein [Planctomycetes bacterium]|nr:VTT domain-containing protein [Nannocystis sp.]MBA3846137.1 VTT domain-containing protein [Planctomycetota bacterium]
MALRKPVVARTIKAISIVLIAGSVIVVGRLVPIDASMQRLQAWIEGAGVWGPVLFGMIYVVLALLMLPASLLTIAAGALFGLVWGTVLVSAASTVAAALAFLIARYLARETVARRVAAHPRISAVDRAVGEGGWRIVVLLRLSPAVPFNLQNYLYGLTPIRFWPCVLASWAAMLPGTFLYVYLGHAGRAGLAATGDAGGRSPAEWAMLVVGLIATVIVTIYVTRLARRALARQTGDSGARQEPAEEAPQSRRAARLWPTLALAVIAVALSSGAMVACSQSDRIRGLFGPPAVELVEQHPDQADGASFDHATLDALLARHVNAAGGVDYAALAADREPLRRYIAAIAEAPFAALGRDEKLALLINAYNAFTLDLLVEWLGRDGVAGIRDIPEARRWDDRRWSIGGQVWSLSQIEHEQIRAKFREPRIHWALVCAAVGCPPLRDEAYTAARLDEQLADQASRVHRDGSRWLRYEPHAARIELTPLYDWYGSDFVQVHGSVAAAVAKHHEAVRKDLEEGRKLQIAWLPYDWSLNSQDHLP